MRRSMVVAGALAAFARCFLAEQAAAATPSIVEFGSTFHSALSGIAIGDDGTIWVAQTDGITRLSRSGDFVQVRRADDCYYCEGSTIGVGAGNRAWQNGFDRVLRFAGTGLEAYDVIHQDCGWAGVRGFATTPDSLFTSREGEAGVRRIDAQGHQTRILPELHSVEAIAAAPDENLWLAVSNHATCGDAPIDRFVRYSTAGVTTAISATGLSHYRLLGPMAAASDGSLILDAARAEGPSNGKITTLLLRLAANGSLNEIASVDLPAWLPLIGGLAPASDGSVWFTLPQDNRIGHVGVDGRVTIIRQGIPMGASPDAIAIDRDGSVWFTDSSRNTVEHLSADGSARVYGNGIAPNNMPSSPVVTSDGAMWFRECLMWHRRIARIARDGSVTEFADDGDSGRLLQANGDGVVETFENPVVSRRFPSMAATLSPDGRLTPFDLSGCLLAVGNMACAPSMRARGRIVVSGATPDWAVRGPDGNLWFTDAANTQIGRVDGTGKVTLFRRGLKRWDSGPQFLAVGPDGALWFTEFRDRVGRITLDGRITEFSRGIPRRSSIGGIVAGRDGNLWFTLYHGNELARMTPRGVITRFRRGIYPSRGNDSNVPDAIPFVDAKGHVWFNEPQGGRIAEATLEP